MNSEGLINKHDLYIKSEKEIIEKIENCENKQISEAFKKFRKTEKLGEGQIPPDDKYCISLRIKRRYINPLVNGKRITEVSPKAKDIIEKVVNYNSPKYAWLDFNF